MLYSFWVLSRVCPELTVVPPRGGKNFNFPRRFSEGGDTMVTYSDLFQYSLVIIGIVGLIIQIFKNLLTACQVEKINKSKMLNKRG